MIMISLLQHSQDDTIKAEKQWWLSGLRDGTEQGMEVTGDEEGYLVMMK